jgi:hypothetical protein
MPRCIQLLRGRNQRSGVGMSHAPDAFRKLKQSNDFKRKAALFRNEFKAGLDTIQIAKAHKTTEADVYNTLAREDVA